MNPWTWTRLPGVNLALNAVAFGLMLLDEALGALAPDVEVVDGVGPWVSSIDPEDVVAAL